MTSWCTRAGRPRTGVADEVASHPHAVDAPSALVDVERHDDLRGTRVSERAGEGPRPNPEPPRGVGRTGYCTVDTSGGRGQPERRGAPRNLRAVLQVWSARRLSASAGRRAPLPERRYGFADCTPPNGSQWRLCQRCSCTDAIGKRNVGVVCTFTPGTRNGLFASFMCVTAFMRPLRVRFLPAALSASTIENASAMPAIRNPSDGFPPGMYFLTIVAASAVPASFLNFGVAGSLPQRMEIGPSAVDCGSSCMIDDADATSLT